MKEIIRLLAKDVLLFYGTIAIPLIYAVGLMEISKANTLEINIILRIIALGLAILGLAFWYGSYWSLGKSFGVLPQKRSRVTTGLYKWFRHPMYLGIIATYFGLAIANQSNAGVVFTLGVLMPLLIARAKWEEKKLID